jgi:Spx/MgsR family transcriptional regulator
MGGVLTLYGIPNCDTVKKARGWLAAQGIDAHFHDFRKGGVPAALDEWAATLGWEALLNRAGTSFRALAEADRTGLDAPRALALMRAAPAMIKRPVLVGHSVSGAPILLLGFKPDRWSDVLKN